jgi:hypothetical protein
VREIQPDIQVPKLVRRALECSVTDTHRVHVDINKRIRRNGSNTNTGSAVMTSITKYATPDNEGYLPYKAADSTSVSGRISPSRAIQT